MLKIGFTTYNCRFNQFVNIQFNFLTVTTVFDVVSFDGPDTPGFIPLLGLDVRFLGV